MIAAASVLRASELKQSFDTLPFALGEIPRGALTEIAGPASSGRTAFLCSMLASASSKQEFCALIDAHDAFVRGTCGGCHQESASGFQIDPRAKGDAKLSRFLVDPSKPRDEVGRRVEWMQLMLFSAQQ